MSHVNTPTPSVLEKKLVVDSFDALENAPGKIYQIVKTAGHTDEAVGCAEFICLAGSESPGGDGGGSNASSTPGVFWKNTNNREVNVCEYGALQDGSDQTSLILDIFTALGSTFYGTIYVPQNVKFNFNAVSLALPKRAIMRDESGINAWDSGGFRQRVVGWIDGSDSTAVSDLAFRISSGHNATLILDNRGTASSNSGQHGIAMVMWTRGQFAKGQPGYRDLSRIEWSENPGTGTWFWVLRKGANWANRDYELWAAGTVFAAGASCRTSVGMYTTVAGGTAGVTEPTHLTGTVSDGGVLWLHVSHRLDDSLFMVNERGEMALNTSPSSSVVLYAKANPDTTGTAALYVEASNASKIASIRLRPTDSSGNPVSMPYHQAQDGVGLRLTTSNTSTTGYTMSDTLGLQLGTYSKKSAVAANNSTTPSVDGIGILILANSSATSITALTTTFAQREVDLFFENANTTLVHNASTFVLRGGVNVNPAANTIITMIKYVNSSAWFEKTRSF